MKRIQLWIIPTVFLITTSYVTCEKGVVSNRTNSEKIDLKLKLEKQRTQRLRVVQVNKIGTTLKGQREEVNSASDTMYTISVENVDDSGLITVKLTFTSLVLRLDGPLGRMIYSSVHPPNVVPSELKDIASIQGKSTLIKLSPDWKVPWIQGLYVVETTTLKEIIERDIALFYQNQPVRVGDSWTKVDQVVITDEFRAPVTMVTKGTLAARANGVATVRARATFKHVAEASTIERGGMKLNYELSGEYEGTAKIDEDSGWPLDATLTYKVSGQLKSETKMPNATGEILISGVMGFGSYVGSYEGSAKSRPAVFEKEITSQDGALMGLVAGGPFIMGRDDGEPYEKPARKVYIDGFYISKYEVTTSQYAKFLNLIKRENPFKWNEVNISKDGQRPVIGVNWYDANAYCQWVGGRLPTEAEWEKAARGPSGDLYPWGNKTPTALYANFHKCCKWEGYQTLAVVGSFEKDKSAYGVYDMHANVSEWTSDWYGENYYRDGPSWNPTGPPLGQKTAHFPLDFSPGSETASARKVIRGGSWVSAPETPAAYRAWSAPLSRHGDVGFRCAKDVPVDLKRIIAEE